MQPDAPETEGPSEDAVAGGEKGHQGEDCDPPVSEDGGPGIWTAVDEFLAGNPKWKIRDKFVHDNGLTVLERTTT
jgi:hypothetical protein